MTYDPVVTGRDRATRTAMHSPAKLESRRILKHKSPDGALSPRQREVYEYLCDGYRASEIAEKLVLSVPTIRTHMIAVYQAYNVHSQLELIRLDRAATRNRATPSDSN